MARIFSSVDRFFENLGFKRTQTRSALWTLQLDNGISLEVFAEVLPKGDQTYVQLGYFARLPGFKKLAHALQKYSLRGLPEMRGGALIAMSPRASSYVPWAVTNFENANLDGTGHTWEKVTGLIDESIPSVISTISKQDYRADLDSGELWTWADGPYAKVLAALHVGDLKHAMFLVDSLTPDDILKREVVVPEGKWTKEEEIANAQAQVLAWIKQNG
ncbi:hypothetical protein [Corynebacterium cystitidis]|uniref:hypothetical protein n=1 Tax=Corynebacterium cystitidis TaxID=35757 RepID=UPI00211E9330|nr:hypothetical protein [Corynebacterium cystitidis]